MPVDVVIPTAKNTQWLQRCLLSLVANTDPATIGKIIVMGCKPLELGTAERLRPILTLDESEKRRSWMDNIIEAREHITSDLALYLHDDCMILPGNPGWIKTMAEPFTQDPVVGAVACVTNDSAGCPHTDLARCLVPGDYYTTWFTPIVVLARPEEWTEAVMHMPDDSFGDFVPPLELLIAGWRVIVTNRVSQFHKQGRSNVRIYAEGRDEQEWIDETRKKVVAHMRKTYPPAWNQRLDMCEMIPVQNYHSLCEGGSEVVM